MNEVEVLKSNFSDNDKADSASSGSSVLAEPACTQLLNHRNVYHHITKNEEIEVQVRHILNAIKDNLLKMFLNIYKYLVFC